MNYVQVLEQLVEAQLRQPLQWVQGNTREFLLQRDTEKPLLLYPWPSPFVCQVPAPCQISGFDT